MFSRGYPESGFRRRIFEFIRVSAAAILAGAATAGEATTPPVGETRIEIVAPASSWDNLSELFLGTTPAAPFGDGSVFVMRGSLRNTSDRAVHHIVLRYELLDSDGKVLHDAEGYNRGAESMRPDEEGRVHEEFVTPIPAGGVDSYRMVFFHDEVPRFTSQRVRVVEVHDQGAAAPAPQAAPVVETPRKERADE
ncbi:MAG: FxLYD domain-containing protein [Candidatus Binatia bacterium]